VPPGSVRVVAGLALAGSVASLAVAVRTGVVPAALLAVILLFLSAGLAGMTVVDRLQTWIDRTRP